MTANDEHTTERIDLKAGDVLYDGTDGEEYALIVSVNDAGVTVRQGDVESFLPHTLFAPWNDDGLVVGHEHRSDAAERTWDVDTDIGPHEQTS